MTSTTEFWAGEFGSEYTQRNRVHWQRRERFWRAIIPEDVKTILEVGTNAGWNLRAIRGAVGIDAVGVDVNQKALLEAAGAGFEVHCMPGSDVSQRFGHEAFDLVFTAGVLIHVPPEDLDQTMAAIVEASKKYVVCVEYAAHTCEMVEYRGHTDKLWKRPYVKLYEAMGLKCIGYGFAGQEKGFDNCAYGILVRQ